MALVSVDKEIAAPFYGAAKYESTKGGDTNNIVVGNLVTLASGHKYVVLLFEKQREEEQEKIILWGCGEVYSLCIFGLFYSFCIVGTLIC